MELTTADKYALSKMPSGEWFSWRHLPCSVRRPFWRCERLEEMGLLIKRLNGVAAEYKIRPPMFKDTN